MAKRDEHNEKNAQSVIEDGSSKTKSCHDMQMTVRAMQNDLDILYILPLLVLVRHLSIFDLCIQEPKLNEAGDMPANIHAEIAEALKSMDAGSKKTEGQMQKTISKELAAFETAMKKIANGKS
eukprot:CAMPEP_0185776694 /NCGR_PEP_ID=MMETSP1174-20130828/86686_1 /TAXON_ID=35687 /ORGANISM="Dictyocha speculum, Strain CCMP1381" /LENGTH=122 /DNA_ID=CAMNT_0028464759 /DNA_START=6 /DNA_END=375 /DNA_ORIENTATION=-